MKNDIVSSPQIFSEFVRMPKPGCRLFGLSRSYLYTLIIPCQTNGFKAPVKSIVIRKRGGLRGIRMINSASLLDWIKSHEITDRPEIIASNLPLAYTTTFTTFAESDSTL